MNDCIQDRKPYVVVKPGLVYYVPSALLFVAAYMFNYILSKAKPSDNIQQDLIIQFRFPLALVYSEEQKIFRVEKAYKGYSVI